MNPVTMQEIMVFNFVAAFFTVLAAIAFWAPRLQRVMRGRVWWAVQAAFLLYWVIIGIRAYMNPVPWGLVGVVGMGLAASMSMLTIRLSARSRRAK